MLKRRVLYLGQKPIGRRCLDLLVARSDEFELVGVVSNATLDNWWRDLSIAEWCAGERVPFIANEQRNDRAIAELIADRRVDLLFSVQHPWVLPRRLLEAVGGRAFNLHLAKLPQYKGWYACSHAILNCDTIFSATLHWMVPEVDSGAIAYEETFAISVTDTAQSVYQRAETAGLHLFEQLLDGLATGRLPPKRPLTGKGALYSRNSLEPLRQVELPAKPDVLDRHARAFFFPPFEPAFIQFGTRKIYLLPMQFHHLGQRCWW
jgi:methionyl-tRNA formyltransferase